MFAGQLTGSNQAMVFQQTLSRYTAVLIMLQAIGHDSIRDLIADFIGMAVADLFTGVNFTHWLSPPHDHMYQSRRPLYLPQSRPAQWMPTVIFYPCFPKSGALF